MSNYEIRTKLVGVTFANSDGSGRQGLIGMLDGGEKLTIEHESSNPYDSNSHIIKNPQGQILGHLSRDLALDVVRRVSQGHSVVGIKSFEKTGGSDKQSFGVNIVLEMSKPDDNILMDRHEIKPC